MVSSITNNSQVTKSKRRFEATKTTPIISRQQLSKNSTKKFRVSVPRENIITGQLTQTKTKKGRLQLSNTNNPPYENPLLKGGFYHKYQVKGEIKKSKK